MIDTRIIVIVFLFGMVLGAGGMLLITQNLEPRKYHNTTECIEITYDSTGTINDIKLLK